MVSKPGKISTDGELLSFLGTVDMSLKDDYACS